MNVFSYVEAALLRLEQLAAWLISDILIFSNLIQIPAVALTGGVAWLVSRPIDKWAHAWVARSHATSYSDWVNRHRDSLVDKFIPLITPTVWCLGLIVAAAVAERLAWPHDVARIAINLLAAWLAIRVLADLVPSPTLARLIAVIAWVIAALNILQLLVPFAALLDNAAISFGSIRVSALTVIKGVLSLAGLLWLATTMSRLFEQRISKLTDLSPRAQVLFGKLLQLSLISLAIVIALTSVGIDMSTFAIFTGAVGVGIGLGLQKTVSNLFSGIVLLLDKSIKPGDVIEVGGTYGWVSSLGARYVSVETRDGMEYLIPNEDIITHQVLNWSHKSERVRLKADVRAPLDADLDLVLSLMRDAATRPARILKHPAPNALVMGFGDSAIHLQLRFWIADAHNGVQNVKGEVLLEIWRGFKREGIEIPFPKRQIFVGPSEREEGAPPMLATEVGPKRQVG